MDDDDDRVDGYKSIPMANAIAADESKKSRRPENSLIVRGSMGSLLVSLYTSRTWTKLYRSSLPDQVSPSIRGVKQAILSDPRRRRTRGLMDPTD